MTDRYDASGSIEGQYQPGSNDKVLLNKLGITSSDDMDQAELELLELLELLYERVLSNVTVDQTITVADLSEWHRMWLGNVYEWAGQARSVNMAKGDFRFAVVAQIPRLLAKLDQTYLGVYTPCQDFDEAQLAEAIAVVHVELILVHPFREGNGRLSRLLANVMALQAGRLVKIILQPSRQEWMDGWMVTMSRLKFWSSKCYTIARALFRDQIFFDSCDGLTRFNGRRASERANTPGTRSRIICPEVNVCLFEHSRFHGNYYSLLTKEIEWI